MPPAESIMRHGGRLLPARVPDVADQGTRTRKSVKYVISATSA